VRTPWLVWKDILLSPKEKVELVGPVGIVRAVARERNRDWSQPLRQSPARVWFAWFEGALIPVLWRVCRELYRPRKVIGIIFLMFIPLANIIVIVWQMKAVRQWLNRHGAVQTPNELESTEVLNSK
jgi:hypothetical protein